MIALLWLLGCAPADVLFTGFVGADASEDAPPLTAGTVGLYVESTGEIYDEGEVGPDGRFEVMAPAGEIIHAVVSGPGLVPASFRGTSGVVETVEIPPGLLHGVSAEELAGWEERFEGCAGVGSGGAAIARVRYFLTGETEPPPVPGVRWTMSGHGGDHGPCFLDDEGTAWDPEAEEAGDAQIVATFGLDEGVYDVVLRYTVVEGVFAEHRTTFYVPEAGVVPRFPLHLEFPIPQ